MIPMYFLEDAKPNEIGDTKARCYEMTKRFFDIAIKVRKYQRYIEMTALHGCNMYYMHITSVYQFNNLEFK